jgi:hypothetical protein
MSLEVRSFIPHSRSENLVIEQLADETLVYDLTYKRAHCLNRFAGLVWQHCDGKRTVSEVSEIIAAELQAPVRPEGVLLALEQLDQARLLASAPVQTLGADRRKLLKVAGIAIAAGAVATIVAPTPARAGSLQGTGASVTDGSQCASGLMGTNGQCI